MPVFVVTGHHAFAGIALEDMNPGGWNSAVTPVGQLDVDLDSASRFGHFFYTSRINFLDGRVFHVKFQRCRFHMGQAKKLQKSI